MLQAAGYAASGRAIGGVIGLDARRRASGTTWRRRPGRAAAPRSAEYDARFADRLAIATAAATGGEPLAAAVPDRRVPDLPVVAACARSSCGPARDVSLVVRGEDAAALRAAGLSHGGRPGRSSTRDDESLPLVGHAARPTRSGWRKAWLRGPDRGAPGAAR